MGPDIPIVPVADQPAEEADRVAGEKLRAELAQFLVILILSIPSFEEPLTGFISALNIKQKVKSIYLTMGKSGLVLYLGFSFGFICYLAVRSDEETGHGVSSSLFLVGMGMVSVVLGILYLSKMGHSGEGKIYVENNRHRHRYSKVERDWTISDSKMIRMPKTRRDLRN